MKPFFSALAFLTRIPVSQKLTGGEDSFSKAVIYYPVIGFLLGAIAVLAFTFLQPLFQPFALAVIMLGVNIVLSGGLHLDGFADCADGFLSSQPRERVFEIMKDSHIGAFGVIALILLLLLKVSLLTSIFADTAKGMEAVFLMPLTGRCVLIINMVLQPCAKKDGLGASLWKRSPLLLLWAFVFLFGVAFLVRKLAGIMTVSGGLAVLFLFVIYTQKKIGGGTGDTLGAGCELSELGVILAAVIIF